MDLPFGKMVSIPAAGNFADMGPHLTAQQTGLPALTELTSNPVPMTDAGSSGPLAAGAGNILPPSSVFTSSAQLSVTLMAAQDSPWTPAGVIPGSPFNPSLLSARTAWNAAADGLGKKDLLSGEPLSSQVSQKADGSGQNEGMGPNRLMSTGILGDPLAVAASQKVDWRGIFPAGHARVLPGADLLAPKTALADANGLVLNERVPPGGNPEEEAVGASVLDENLLAQAGGLVFGLVVPTLLYGSLEKRKKQSFRGLASFKEWEADLWSFDDHVQ